ncbi:MAG TPA: DNA recombination protein RmuC [Acidimicrobiia bacterium]
MTSSIVSAVIVLAAVGLCAAVVVFQRRSARELADELRRATAEQGQAALGETLERVLAANRHVMETEREVAARELQGKKSLIDQQLEAMAGRLDEVGTLMQQLESDREQKFGRLSAQLDQQHEGLSSLLQTTQSLREALSSSKARGQWGERMAEDVLRLSGLVENVNYRKQRAIEGGVPDFTFFLPNDLLLHMDVKFPLDNYVRCIEAQSDLDRKRYRDDFLRDVRHHVRALASRSYVDPAGGTVDFVLLFIPNEQLYGFIHEEDAVIGEDAARSGVILCSPLTLFAVLALIRQTVDNFQLAKTSNEILALLGTFKKQWGMFVDKMDKLDRSLCTVRRDYDELVGTRRRALERPLDKIEALRQSEELSLVDDADDEPGGTFALEA